MSKNWWFKFDFKVWRTDSRLRRCSLETRAFWLELLCVMHETDADSITGSRAELARIVGCLPEEANRCIAELKRTGTADVTEHNGDVTLLSRRVSRELKAKNDNKLRQQKYRSNADVTDASQHRVISKSKNKKESPADAGTFDSIFDEFRVMLQNAGTNEKSARSKIGGLVKTHGKPKVTAAFNANKDAIAASIEPYAYFCKILKSFVYEDDLTKKIKNAKRYHHEIYGGLEYDVPFKPERYNITQEEYARYCAAN